MLKPELYKRTVDILVDAYFKHTLEHGNSCACAIGNIVAANTGLKYGEDSTKFSKLYWIDGPDPLWYNNPNSPTGLRQIGATGYTFKQIFLIEKAFENVCRGASEDEYMFNGLMGVIDCLDIIHENKDTQTTTETKKRFVKV